MNLLQSFYAQQQAAAAALEAQRRAAAQAAYDRSMTALNNSYNTMQNSLKGNYNSTLGQLEQNYNTGVAGVNKQANNAQQQAYNGYWGGAYQTSTGFGDVRSLIASGRIADAEQILNGVPTDSRNAEWYFLKGTVLYKRGWLDEATNHFSRACQMDPGNPEYRAAFNQITGQRYGQYGGYNPQTDTMNGGCSACDVCSSLMIADCCCECMGGDLIPCC